MAGLARAVDSFNGNVTGFVGASGLDVSGSTEGDFATAITGVLTEYSNPGQRVSFSGTISGAITGTLTGGVNYNGYDTLFAEVTGSSASGHVYLIGEFSGGPGEFIGRFVTQENEIDFITEIVITGGDSVLAGSELQMSAATSPEGASDEVAWAVYVNDLEFATIDQTTGLLTAIKPGTVTVIASALDGSLKTQNYNVTVTPVMNTTKGVGYSTIQAAVDTATPGDIINVGAGSYTENLTINNPIHLLGPNATVNPNNISTPRSTEAVITGQITDYAGDTDIKGFTITNPSYGGATIKGVWVHSAGSVISNIAIENNIFSNITNGQAHGSYGVMVQGVTSGVNILNNKFDGITATVAGGWAHAIEVTPTGNSATVPQNTTITGNVISSITNPSQSDAYAFSVDSATYNSNPIYANASQITFNHNSLLGNVRNLDPNNTLSANNNYWGSAGPSFGTIISGNVNHDSWYVNSEMTILSGAVEDNTVTAPSGDDDLVLSLGFEGNVDLPDGVTDVVLDDDSGLDLSAGIESLEDDAPPVEIGGETVIMTQQVVLQSGENGQPIVLTNSDPDLLGFSVSIPDGTEVQGPDGWDGTIMPPTDVLSEGTAPSGFSVGDTVIEVGSSGVVLLFDKAVKITLTGVTGTVGYKPASPDNDSDWVTITTPCTDAEDHGISFPGECYSTVGDDTIIWTFHFTSFGELDPIPPSGGGSIGIQFLGNPTPTPTPTATPTPEVLGEAITRGNPANLSANGLKEGDSVSAGGTNDPDVYIVNQFGYKRLFLSPAIFEMYGHLKNGWGRVRSIIAQTRDAFPTSVLFRNCETNDLKVYALETTSEDVAVLHWVNLTGDQAVAQDAEFFKKVFCINSNEFNWYAKSSTDFSALSQIPVYARH